MAKATSRGRGAIARAGSDSLKARARDLVEEPVLDDEDDEPEAQENADLEDAAPVDDDTDDTDDMDLALPESYRQELAAAPGHVAVPARGPQAPAWVLGNPITRFIYESYQELRKATWPTMQQAWTMTLLVVAMSAFVAIILSVADLGLVRFLTWLLSLGQ